MPQDIYEVVRVTTPEGGEHTFFCDDDNVTIFLDAVTGYLFIGPESDLTTTDTDTDGFKAVYAPGQWSIVEQIVPPEDED